MRNRLIVGFVVLGLLAVALAGCSSSKTEAPAQAATPTAAPAAAPASAELEKRVKTLEDFVKVQGSINPGLGTIMIEYSQRMAKLYFAGQAEAWDEAVYQLDEMKEIQEVGEITRPKRADALKTFENKYLNPLENTIKAKNKGDFTVAYTKTVEGCNTCHTTTKSDAFPNGYGWVKIVVPKASPVDYQDLTAK